jgi:crotonobetainyl-CoA:carnitine CoA-transferase CaiB-like acyl-CoA transferase
VSPPEASAPGATPGPSPRPLDGIRVVELGQLLAGPFAGTLLAYFGADVVKVEPPGDGDPIRGWRLLDQDGTSHWWRSLGRNKRSLTANLRSEGGRAVVRRLLVGADVVIENFRPGTLERWGLGPSDVEAENPGLIWARISGYGQTGPWARKPGYASVTEAFSGFRHVNGFPGEAPVRPNLSLGDSVAGLHAAFGIVLALLARRRDGADPTGTADARTAPAPARGQTVDVALYESMFNLMEAVIPEYAAAGEIRQASGTTLTGIVPTNTYPCADERYVVIGGNGDSIYKRLMKAAGRGDLAEDPRLAHNAGRVAHQETIDEAIAAWTRSLPSEAVLDALDAAEVPAGPILDAAAMYEHPQYRARGLFETARDGTREHVVPAILPRLTGTPGRTTWAGPAVGEHTDAVLAELGYDAAAVRRLRENEDV